MRGIDNDGGAMLNTEQDELKNARRALKSMVSTFLKSERAKGRAPFSSVKSYKDFLACEHALPSGFWLLVCKFFARPYKRPNIHVLDKQGLPTLKDEAEPASMSVVLQKVEELLAAHDRLRPQAKGGNRLFNRCRRYICGDLKTSMGLVDDLPSYRDPVDLQGLRLNGVQNLHITHRSSPEPPELDDEQIRQIDSHADVQSQQTWLEELREGLLARHGTIALASASNDPAFAIYNNVSNSLTCLREKLTMEKRKTLAKERNAALLLQMFGPR